MVFILLRWRLGTSIVNIVVSRSQSNGYDYMIQHVIIRRMDVHALGTSSPRATNIEHHVILCY